MSYPCYPVWISFSFLHGWQPLPFLQMFSNFSHTLHPLQRTVCERVLFFLLGAAEDVDVAPVMIEGVSVLVKLGTSTWFMGRTEVGITVVVVDSVLLAANSPRATRSRMSHAYDSLFNWSNCSQGIQLWYRPLVHPPRPSDRLPRLGATP